MHFIVSYEVIIADITYSVKIFNFCKAHMRFDPVGNNKKMFYPRTSFLYMMCLWYMYV